MLISIILAFVAGIYAFATFHEAELNKRNKWQ